METFTRMIIAIFLVSVGAALYFLLNTIGVIPSLINYWIVTSGLILGTIVVGAILLQVIPLVFRSIGTKILLKDVAYLGLKRSEIEVETLYSFRITKAFLSSKNQTPSVTYSNRLYAWLAYRAYFRRNTLEKYYSRDTGYKEIKFSSDLGYLEGKLRKETFAAIEAERKFLKTRPINPNWAFPPATYFYVLNQYDESVYEKVETFLREGLTPENSDDLKVFTPEQIQETSGLPVNWRVSMLTA
jgi:hypothetical protein